MTGGENQESFRDWLLRLDGQVSDDLEELTQQGISPLASPEELAERLGKAANLAGQRKVIAEALGYLAQHAED